ncbi:MAG: M36 family metallopeptidase [Thermoanaerobaculia bacterium]
MRRLFAMFAFGLGFAASAFAAKKEEPAARDAAPARIYKAAPGQALTKISQAPPGDAVARFLESKGKGAAAIASLKTVSEKRSARTGITHVRMEQQVGGLRVEGAYLKAAVNERGQLVHVIDALARVSGRPSPASVTDSRALGAALAALHAGEATPALLVRHGNVAAFERGTFFHSAPTVERVAIPLKDGSLQTGFLVTTWTAKTNLLYETLVSGSGEVIATELRTNSDTYNVFTEDPDKGPQTVQPGPGGSSPESPAGWLAGSQTTLNIGGNNVHSYLDLNADNKVDGGGTPVTDGNFTAAADLTVSPTTTANRSVAVQNLFYLTNRVHDILYRAGFDELAENFQENNFNFGGKASDSVDAEAQDGAGVDNANFATPHDGQNPRMQMFLWTGKGTHQVTVGATNYRAQGAGFGPALDTTGVPGTIIVAQDGTAPAGDGCEAIAALPANSIAVIDRGLCGFVVKVKNAQLAGAAGVIIVNNIGTDSIFTMGGADNSITIPSVMIGKSDGDALKAIAPLAGSIHLAAIQPLQRDGDVDSDIVYHEYGHGLTWRMIGKMSGPMAGAIGEGMSDVLAVIINGDDVVGEYSFSDSFGIRSRPYTNYFGFRTYGDVAGTEVHLDGEVYGAIGWRLRQLYVAAGLTPEDLLADLLDGMNFTPETPSFELMRDGILASIGDEARCNLVWQAFAEGGVGVGATSKTTGAGITVTESFVPGVCH